MKKWLFFWTILVLTLFAGIYLIIPSTIEITSSKIANTSDNGTQRYLLDQANWKIWWNYTHPSKVSNTSGGFTMNEDKYTLTSLFYKSADITITHKNQVITSKVVIIPVTQDSTGIEWKCSLTPGYNPLNRINAYLEARKIKKNIDLVLTDLSAFLSKLENVYGIHIERTNLKDTLFVTTKSIAKDKPSLNQIYGLIKNIQSYITKKGIPQSGNPIYNITQLEDDQYQLMAGVPVNQNIPDADGYSTKFMVKGSFMVTEVLGGDSSVNRAYRSLQQYFQDFRKTSMAMNFNMLVTDRKLQTDSSKWITKLYYPVY